MGGSRVPELRRPPTRGTHARAHTTCRNANTYPRRGAIATHRAPDGATSHTHLLFGNQPQRRVPRCKHLILNADLRLPQGLQPLARCDPQNGLQGACTAERPRTKNPSAQGRKRASAVPTGCPGSMKEGTGL